MAIIVNGKVISSGNGNNIVISNNSIIDSNIENCDSLIIGDNKVIINGIDATPDEKEINIQITGDVQKVEN